MERIPPLDEYVFMSAEPDNTIAMVSVEKIQRDWMIRVFESDRFLTADGNTKCHI